VTDDTNVLEFLRNNSHIHKVVQGNQMVFKIAPANDSEECWREFQMLVAAAKALRGIKVLAHANSMRPPFNDPPLGEIYDCAGITVLP
jgi:hypothetical protein